MVQYGRGTGPANSCARVLATADEGLAIYQFAARFQLAPGTDQLGTVRAVSAETGRTTWLHEQRAATLSLVTTGGGLILGGDVNGRFRAFDQETGEVVWEINLGSPVTGFPITFAVDGRQYVAASAKGQGQGLGRSRACGKCKLLFHGNTHHTAHRGCHGTHRRAGLPTDGHGPGRTSRRPHVDDATNG